jgi:hypothetical protein
VRRPPQACADDPLGAEMFLDIAAGFLERRADRAELIERLRERVLPRPPEDAPAAASAEAAAAASEPAPAPSLPAAEPVPPTTVAAPSVATEPE